MKLSYSTLMDSYDFGAWCFHTWWFSCSKTHKLEIGIRLIGIEFRFKDGCTC